MGYGSRYRNINTPTVVVAEPNISLNNVSQEYTSIYSFSGSGELHNFVLDFDSDNILCKLTIDERTVFDLDCDILDNMLDDETYTGSGLWIKWDSNRNALIFTAPQPIPFTAGFTISAKANSSSDSRDLDRYQIEYEVN